MITLHQQFLRAIRWNALEKLLYNPLYFLHYTVLFKVTDTALYGLAGAIFSTLYLAGTITSFGFNGALHGFLSELTVNKRNFLTILTINFIPQLIIFLGIIGGLLLGLIPLPNVIESDHFALIMITGALITESTKKKLKSILQLSFKNRATAISEVFSLIIYLLLFWGGYLLNIPISLSLLFTPLLISSSITVAVLLFNVYHLYQSLPEALEPKISSQTWKAIGIARVVSFLHETFEHRYTFR